MEKNDPKTKCARLCVDAVVRCAKDVEKAMASCGVKNSGFFRGEPGDVVAMMVRLFFESGYFAEGPLSRWKPDAKDIGSLSRGFRKVRAGRKAKAGK